MILVGNSRAGGQNLAHHLMSPENELVTVHSVDGFAADDLHGAFKEAEAISRGTRCRKYLFSLSLNPPANETVETKVFEDAITHAEQALGLTGQPRATVFHEKHGADGNLRRHCHVVWSRIDTEAMKAVPMDHSKLKLNGVAKELYLEHEWDIPKGFINPALRDGKNLTLAEWQQAKRFGKDPREVKAIFQNSWQQSDSKAAFTHALHERGLTLARGDRRGFVATDMHGKVYPIARWVGIKAKDVRTRLGDAKDLPSLEQAKEQLADRLTPIVEKLRDQEEEKLAALQAKQEQEKAAAQAKADAQRQLQKQWQEQRETKEAQKRQDRFNTGARGFVDRLSGVHKRTDAENRLEAYRKAKRDQSQRDALIAKQQNQADRLDALREKQLEKPRAISNSLQYDRSRLDSLRNREGQTPQGMDGPER